jgi:hypothetical protein
MIWDKSLGQFSDLNGKPAHTMVSFFKTGTTEAVRVFKDTTYLEPHAYAIASDSLGRIPAVYIKPGSGVLRADITTGKYKLRSIDGIDPGTSLGTSAANVISFPTATTQTTNQVTITAEQFGSFVPIRTATGQAVPVMLPRATTVPNGPLLGIRNTGSGTVIVRPSSPDLIDGVKAKVIGPGKSLVITPTGAEYFTFSESAPVPRQWTVKNRTTASPPSGVVGDSYLAAANASGGWTTDRIYESDGSNGWIAYTPQIGDRAAVTAETVTVNNAGTDSVTLPLMLIYSGTKWVSEAAYAEARAKVMIEPVANRVTALENAKEKSGHLQVIRAAQGGSSGTTSLAAQGGTQPTAGNWTVNTLTESAGDLGSRSSNKITLPTGKYRARASRQVKGAISAALALRNTSGSILVRGMPRLVDASANELVTLDGPFELSASTELELVFMLSGTVGALSLGDAAALPGEAEMFAELVIESRTPS